MDLLATRSELGLTRREMWDTAPLMMTLSLLRKPEDSIHSRVRIKKEATPILQYTGPET